MDYFAIGQRIRRIRKAKSYSQEQLAEMTGISVTHMSHIETGNTKLSLEVFYNIVNALECTADELLFCLNENSQAVIHSNISEILDKCSVNELNLIYDIIKTLKASLDKYI
ncbi:MAG: helix-turn-helix transcriptional regulator [Ruminiclostridium sp.]|nr:helix-turn-helix transcriptional regulator [Ruminiclostridium sp.]